MRKIAVFLLLLTAISGAFAKNLNEQAVNQAFFKLVNQHRKSLGLQQAKWSDAMSTYQRAWSQKNLEIFKTDLDYYQEHINPIDSARVINAIIKSAHNDCENRINLLIRQMFTRGSFQGQEICGFMFVFYNDEQKIAEDLFKSFLASQSHKEIIEKNFNGEELYLGVGTAIINNRIYSSTIFVKKNKSCS